MLKTVLLVAGDFIRTGGMDMANYALAQRLAERGVAVHLVAHSVADELQALPNVTVHLASKPLGHDLLGAPLLDRKGRKLAAQITSGGGGVLVNGGNCAWGDVNWVHYVHAAYRPNASGFLYRIKSRLTHRLFLREEKAALSKARVIVANSERTRRDLIDRVGVAPERVHTIYYGIDAERFRPRTAAESASARKTLEWPADSPVVAFVGALADRRKGFDVLFEAWRTLCADPAWDADLVVVGSGAELQAWVEKAGEAGLQDRIRFLGFRRDLPVILAASDALVSPTRYEAFGLGVLEALACGMPAIVSRTAGVAERYPSELTPLLIDDPDDVAGLIERLRHWRREKARFDEAARVHASAIHRHGWEQMADEIITLAFEGN